MRNRFKQSPLPLTPSLSGRQYYIDNNGSGATTNGTRSYKDSTKIIKEDSFATSELGSPVFQYYFLQIMFKSIIYCLFVFVLFHFSILIYQQWLKAGILKWENILSTSVGLFFLFLLLSASYYLIFCNINSFVLLMTSKLSTFFQSLISYTSSAGDSSSSSSPSRISERECFQLFQLLDKEKKGFLVVSELAVMLEKTMKNEAPLFADQKISASLPFTDAVEIANVLDDVTCDGKRERDGKIYYDEFRLIFLT
jgi:hypothetical protein